MVTLNHPLLHLLAGNSDYTKIDTNSPSDLLPHDNNAGFANLTSGNTDLPDLMAAGAAIGIDTVGQTLKNANLQLRSDPVIKKEQVGPWNHSTFEPDLGRCSFRIRLRNQISKQTNTIIIT